MNPNDAKIVAMMLVRNESWSVGAVASATLEWCDELVVLDDGSTDATPDILASVTRAYGSDRLFYHYCKREEGDIHRWREMELRQRLFSAAKTRNATHFAVVDADELPTAPLIPHLRSIVAECNPTEGITVPMISPYCSLTQRRTDGHFQPHSGIFIGFRNTPGLGWSPGADGYQHHQRAPRGCKCDFPRFDANEGGIMHLQFASLLRLQAKSAYYKAFETVMYPGRMTPAQLNEKYDWALSGVGMTLQPIPVTWWKGHSTTFIDLDQRPWQLDALHDIVNRHGTGIFAGLNFHGLLNIA